MLFYYLLFLYEGSGRKRFYIIHAHPCLRGSPCPFKGIFNVGINPILFHA